MPRAISQWNLLYLPIMAITFAVGAVGYAYARHDPMHMGFDGTVNDWAEKPRSSCGCRYSSRFMAACSCSPTGPHRSFEVGRTRRAGHVGAGLRPVARAQSIYLVAGGVVMAAMIAMPLSFMNVIDLGQAAVFIMIAAIARCRLRRHGHQLVYGQAGVFAFKNMQTSDRLHGRRPLLEVRRVLLQPRRCQPVPARAFRVGWTLNWARPAVWAIVAGGFVVTAASWSR